MMVTRYNFFGLLLTLTACAPRTRSTVPGRNTALMPGSAGIPGCYELLDGAWAHDARLERFMPLCSIPRTFQLDTVMVPGWDELQQVERPMFAVRTRAARVVAAPFVFWQRDPAGGDAIIIGAPLAMGGATLHVRPGENGLVGELMTFTDAIPPDGVASASAAVRLERIACR